jgi:hypothetical protein
MDVGGSSKKKIDHRYFVKSILELMHVIKKVIGSQFLVLVTGKKHLQYGCSIEAHCFKLMEKTSHKKYKANIIIS